jgi:hypothetical protein
MSTTLKSRELTVKPSFNESTTKTYTFDKVFGPECDQPTLYEEVVSPMLHEVLTGFNCTIFAYGQVGVFFLCYKASEVVIRRKLTHTNRPEPVKLIPCWVI